MSPPITTPAESPPTRSRSATWLSWAVWLFTLCEVAAILTLVALNQLALVRFFEEYIFFGVATTLAFATIGLLITARHPRNVIGGLLSAAGVSLGFAVIVQQLARYAAVTRPGTVPGTEFIAWLNFWAWIPIVALFAVFLPMFFPDGRLSSPRWRPVFGFAVFATAFLAFSLAITPGHIDNSLPEVVNPFTSPLTDQIHALVSGPAAILMGLALLSAAAAPLARMRRATGIERQQLRWFAYAAGILVAAFVIPILINLPHIGQETLLSGIMLSVAGPFVPIAVGIAVLRYRLYDVDVLINRTLTYGLLTVFVVATYVGVVGYLSTLVPDQWTLGISLAATGVIAVLFHPLRDRLQHAANRLLYGDRDSPYEVLSRLGQRLEAAQMPDAILPAVASTIKDALRVPYVAITIAHDDGFTTAAAQGIETAEQLCLSLSYQGEVVGQLLVSPRSPGEGWSTGDRRLLDDLARQAGVTVHGVRAIIQLKKARERLILAREEERQRLRRDLHDDLAPSLAALALTAATAEELIRNRPAEASTVLAKLQESIRAAVGDVRRLAYDLRPPMLDELGFVGALRDVIARWNLGKNSAERRTERAPHFSIDIPDDLPPLPAAVEVAAYRIIQESLMNVVRHASASICTARLRAADRCLHLEIIDDGLGLPETRVNGLGLRSMQERAAELGGKCTIEAVLPAGTRVSASLPIEF